MIRRWATAALLAAACGKPAPPPVEAGATRSDVPAEASVLGNELFELIDRAVEYRSSHSGRPATELRALGLDSLSPTTARALIGTDPIAFASRLRTGGSALSSCSATEDVLEQASLNEGRFTVQCETAAGVQTFEIVRPVAPARK